MQYILTMHCENMHWPRTARKLLSAGNTPVIPQALTLSIDPTFRSKFGCDHQMRIAPAHLRIPPELVESHRKCYHREVQNTTEEKANVGVAACTKAPVAFRKMWKAVPTHFLSLFPPLPPSSGYPAFVSNPIPRDILVRCKDIPQCTTGLSTRIACSGGNTI